jgi:hypothetical protein
MIDPAAKRNARIIDDDDSSLLTPHSSLLTPAPLPSITLIVAIG